jgi:hypothetical protein
VQAEIKSGAWSSAAVTCNTAIAAVSNVQAQPVAPYRIINKPWQQAIAAYLAAYDAYETALNHESQAGVTKANTLNQQAATDLVATNVQMQAQAGETIPAP